VGRAIAVVPRLGEMAVRLVGHSPVDGQSEGNANAILMNVKPTRKLHGLAGVANALKTGVGHPISPPAAHAANIELTVFGIETATMHAGQEFARKRHDRSLV